MQSEPQYKGILCESNTEGKSKQTQKKTTQTLNESPMEIVFQIAEQYGQGHLIEHYKSLNSVEKQESFLKQLQSIDFAKTASLYKNVYLASKNQKEQAEPKYSPIEQVADRNMLNEFENQFNQIGKESISKGQVGVCIMSGGQGTRLGFDHPKGMFNIGLDSHFTLFNFFARKLLRLMEIVKAEFPESPRTQKNMIKWYIMTSEMNNTEVVTYFKENNYFGYDPQSIVFFPQGGIPAVDFNGKIVIEDEGLISLAPGGNGAIYQEMLQKNVLKHMKNNNVKYIYLAPVDNILLKLGDPSCLGYMIKNNLDIVSTYVNKISAQEKVGLHLLYNGKVRVCEYSQTTPKVKQLKDQKGQHIFKHGNRATMFISRNFIQSITTNNQIVQRINTKYHLAEKKIKYYNPQQKKSFKPNQVNGVKFQLFYFDVFQETDKFGLFQTIRSDQFAPVKNAEGDDSPASAKTLLRNLHMKWIMKAGIKLQGQGYVEIDPILCYNGQGLKQLIQKKYNSDTIKLPIFIQ